MTRVLLDRQAGFCAGVRRAVNGARRARRESDGPVAVYGELVHNPEVTSSLEREGIRVVRDLEELGDGDRVILRSHGIGPAERERLRERGLRVHDFTCPRVREAQRTIERHRAGGYTVLIVGHPDHPEVRGHLGHAGAAGRVVSSPGEAEGVPLERRVLVVAQTTAPPELFRAAVDTLRRRAGSSVELEVVDTLCPSVLQRQEWIREASRRAGAAIVVGGRGSSNTRRLVETAAAHGPVFWIERPEELDLERVLRLPAVALTAGASTPDESVQAVLQRLTAAGAHVERR